MEWIIALYFLDERSKLLILFGSRYFEAHYFCFASGIFSYSYQIIEESILLAGISRRIKLCLKSRKINSGMQREG